MSNGRRTRTRHSIDGLVGFSPSMQHVFSLVTDAAACTSNVLVQGETGTGKRTIAHAIHKLSNGEKPFHQINCAALDATQVEKSLFGEETPGLQSGLLQQDIQGTLFIEEINLMTPTIQARLLEFLESRHDHQNRAEAENEHRCSLRLIVASNCELVKEVSENRFREDLFWRLSVLPIHLPPLRRRSDDVEALVLKSLQAFSSDQKTVDKIHPDSLAALKSYQWPGNVRELQNYVERAFVAADSQELTPELLPTSLMGDRQAAEQAVFRPTDEKSLVHEFVYNRLRKAPDNAADLHKQIVEPIEKELLVQILDICNHVQKKAADRLGINRNTLYKKLKEYGLEKPNAKASAEETDPK